MIIADAVRWLTLLDSVNAALDQLETHREQVSTAFQRVGNVAHKRGEAGLVRIGATLPNRKAVSSPDLGRYPVIMVRITIAPRVDAAA